ncbi:MAG: hypothetical protein WCA20_12355 [Candidatus Sulfotelmatobacter sp.]
MIIQRGDISTTGATPEGRQGVIFTNLLPALPALIVRNRCASLDLLRPNLEVRNPALVKNRTVAAFRLDFKPRLIIEEMIQIRICVSSTNLENAQCLPRRKRRAGYDILPNRPNPLRLPAAATVEQIAWPDRRLTIPLDSKPLYDGRTSAAVPQVKVNRVYGLQHVTGREADDGKGGGLHLFLVGGDELLHRTPVVDGDDERNNRDEDC